MIVYEMVSVASECGVGVYNMYKQKEVDIVGSNSNTSNTRASMMGDFVAGFVLEYSICVYDWVSVFLCVYVNLSHLRIDSVRGDLMVVVVVFMVVLGG